MSPAGRRRWSCFWWRSSREASRCSRRTTRAWPLPWLPQGVRPQRSLHRPSGTRFSQFTAHPMLRIPTECHAAPGLKKLDLIALAALAASAAPAKSVDGPCHFHGRRASRIRSPEPQPIFTRYSAVWVQSRNHANHAINGKPKWKWRLDPLRGSRYIQDSGMG